jgi:hypothetical protein
MTTFLKTLPKNQEELIYYLNKIIICTYIFESYKVKLKEIVYIFYQLNVFDCKNTNKFPIGTLVFLLTLYQNSRYATGMKAIALSYFWWPGIDNYIENTERNCEKCMQVRPGPPKAVLTPWKWPEQVWTCIHVDFSGPYKNKIFLIVVDVTSKWLEVFEVSTSTASVVIIKMQELFSRSGFPKVITNIQFNQQKLCKLTHLVEPKYNQKHRPTFKY